MPRLVDNVGDVTTLILHGLPSRKKLTDIVPILEALGFGPHCFDYLYLPCRSSRDRDGAGRDRDTNLGYLFINFVSPALALAFSRAVHRHPLGREVDACDKVFCGAAKTQGLEANLALIRDAGLDDQLAPHASRRVCFARVGESWRAWGPCR